MSPCDVYGYEAAVRGSNGFQVTYLDSHQSRQTPGEGAERGGDDADAKSLNQNTAHDEAADEQGSIEVRVSALSCVAAAGVARPRYHAKLLGVPEAGCSSRHTLRRCRTWRCRIHAYRDLRTSRVINLRNCGILKLSQVDLCRGAP